MGAARESILPSTAMSDSPSTGGRSPEFSPAGPPTLGELLVGPFRGLVIYPRAARTPPLHTVALLLLATVVMGGALTAQWYDQRVGWLEDARHSALYLMPTVTIDGGVARTAGPPKLYDAVHFLVWVDVSTNTLVFGDVPLEAGEQRPLVHVGRTMLAVHRRDGAPQPLEWTSLEARFGSMSLDGTEVAGWLRAELPAAALTRLLAGLLAATAWQLFLLATLAFVYRVIFYRGLYVPRYGTVIAVGATAGLPAVVVAALVGLSGLGQVTMIGTHATVLGFLFLAAASRVRLADDDRDRSSEAVAPAGER